MDLGLKGKVALVTASGSGIGRAIALTFAAEGADVIINDLPPSDLTQSEMWSRSHGRSGGATAVLGARAEERAEVVADECRNLGVRAFTAYGNVTKRQDVQELVKRSLDELGRIDVLVNNAGGWMNEPFVKSSPENWDYVINMCLYSSLYFCREVTPHMAERGSGAVVNILSDAWKGNDRGFAVYGAAKAAVGSFTRTLAGELGRSGVRVNAVSPAGTETEAIKEARRQRAAEVGEEAEQAERSRAFRSYPLAQAYAGLGRPQDIADMVVFLSSERARWVTGQTMSVSGGYHMH